MSQWHWHSDSVNRSFTLPAPVNEIIWVRYRSPLELCNHTAYKVFIVAYYYSDTLYYKMYTIIVLVLLILVITTYMIVDTLATGTAVKQYVF